MDSRTIEEFATEIAELIAIELPNMQTGLSQNNVLKKKIIDYVQNKALLTLFFKDIKLKETIISHRQVNPMLLKQHYNTKMKTAQEISQSSDPMIDIEDINDKDKAGIYWFYKMPVDMYCPIMFFQNTSLADFAIKTGQFYGPMNGVPPYNADYLGLNSQQYMAYMNNLQDTRLYNYGQRQFNGFLQLSPTGQNDLRSNVWYGLMNWPDIIIWYVPLKFNVVYGNEEIKDLYRRYITWQLSKQGVIENQRLANDDSSQLPLSQKTLNIYNYEKSIYLNKLSKRISLT